MALVTQILQNIRVSYTASVTQGNLRVDPHHSMGQKFVLTLGRMGARSLLYTRAQILLSHKKIACRVSPALTQPSVYSPSQGVSNSSASLEPPCAHFAFVGDDD